MDTPQDLPEGWRRVDGYERYDGKVHGPGLSVPGAGPVLFVFVCGTTLYALRDNEDHTAPVLWKVEGDQFVIAKQGD